MRVEIAEFMRRFLLHVLPNGFHRIRHYGLLANGHRAEKLALCRRLLTAPIASTVSPEKGDHDLGARGYQPPPCPCCGGRLRIVESLRWLALPTLSPAGLTPCSHDIFGDD